MGDEWSEVLGGLAKAVVMGRKVVVLFCLSLLDFGLFWIGWVWICQFVLRGREVQKG